MKYISIHEFAYKSERTVPAIRFLISTGASFGKLNAVRQGKQIYLDEEQLYTFRFTKRGRFKIPTVYHYNGEKMVECPECTAGQKCPQVKEDGHWIGVKDE